MGRWREAGRNPDPKYVTGHAKNGQLPDDIDWRSLADPATTTAIYMPTRTLAALVTKAIGQGLDPATPAVAIACATRPDQIVIADAIASLPARIDEANLPGPLLVMIGQICRQCEEVGASSDVKVVATV